MELLNSLQQLTNNPQASFHQGQEEAILSVIQGKAVLCVQRTGWGKSAVYFLATKKLREQGKGPTIIVSPLLALMRNQLESASRLGLVAETINSTNFDDWQNIEEKIHNDEVDLLLLSPERLMNPQFRKNILPSLAQNCGLLVVDEAHCISDWGHDFRPDYRRIKDLISLLPQGIGILGTTATANQRVQDDVGEQLQSKERPLVNIRGPLNRESLRLEVVEVKNPAYRLAWLKENINDIKGSGIVYALTVSEAHKISEWLNNNGIVAKAYSGSMDNQKRLEAEEMLKNNQIKALVATSALGMGYDKPDLGFVIHMGAPISIIDYWQQAGRAGRDNNMSEAILLKTASDKHVQEYFVSAGIPSEENVKLVINNISDQPQSTQNLLPSVNLGQSRLELLLKILAVEGLAERVEGGWVRTDKPIQYDKARYQGLLKQRQHEYQKMLDFGKDDMCLQKTICEELDDHDAKNCGKCSNCTNSKWDIMPSPMALKAAQMFLRQNLNSLPVKKRWPKTADSKAKKIPENLRPEEILTVSRAGDGGWDEIVQDILQGKQIKEFPELIGWLNKQLEVFNIDWITIVPTRKREEVMNKFAKNLAKSLNIPFYITLERISDRPSQLELYNSSLQFENLKKSHKVVSTPSGKGLIIDDQIQSGWTINMTAGQLQHNNVQPLVALCLSQL